MALSWLDLHAFVRHAPNSTAIYRAINPDWWVTPEVKLLREMEYSLRWLMWAQTSDGAGNRNIPQPLTLTEEEREAAKSESERYTAQTVDATMVALGWSN